VSLQQWNERYRAGEQLFDTPSPLVERFAGALTPGNALDLASGPGRNAVYLAEQGWRVTAVDGSPVAIDALLARARQRNLNIDARVADLERSEFSIELAAYDLICDCYYLQRSLFPHMKAGLRPGGMLIAIVHLAEADQPRGTPTRAIPGELRSYFPDWMILHYYEGKPNESCHQRPVAELVAQKPLTTNPLPRA
jgi:tellurite methyltransferase